MADVAAPERTMGMGCMRLSTASDRDEDRGVAVILAALDAGVAFLDTADAYAWNDEDIGHNERLIARALSQWTGERARITVATKGGLTRPEGRWVTNGRAKHLVAACARSRRALGVDQIDLYQLHAPDPRTPFATSVRALETLRRDGLVSEIGLCNVNLKQIEEARRIAPIASVQVELSLWHDAPLLNGVVSYCLANGIRVVAHRPLGGARLRKRVESDPLLVEIAGGHHASAHEIALAWLYDLSQLIVPVPGATRIETARSVANAGRIQLTEDDRARLDARVPAARMVRGESAASPPRAAPRRTDGEVVLVMGLPAAGKSIVARDLVTRGYARLNRDETGGTLGDLVPALERLVESDASRIVLDNTYISRAARAPVIHAAAELGLPVRGVWLDTSIEDAQTNAVTRMLERYGRLLSPEEIRSTSRKDPAVFAPTAQFRLQRELEVPDVSEGFSSIERIPFQRRGALGTNRAILLWCDGVLRRSRSNLRTPSSPDDVTVSPERGEQLRRCIDDGWKLIGLSWQPEIAAGEMRVDEVDAAFARMQELLRIAIDVFYCPHAAGPPVCWCRKPLPGLGVVCIERFGLDPARCLYVGAGSQDPGFARRLGFQYRDADEFFESPAAP